MARRLDVDGYSHDEVMAAVLARAGGKPDFRIRVTDRFGNDQDDIDLQVHDAVVTFDSQRLIKGSLALEMEPVPEMLRRPFQYVLWPELGFGPMRDGARAWLPYGAYVWPAPRRVIPQLSATGNVDRWTVACGDLNVLHNMNGPGLTPFTAPQNVAATDALIYMLAVRIGETDLSRVDPSDEILTESLSWTVRTGARARRRLTGAQYAQALRTWNATIKMLAAARRRAKTNPKHKHDRIAPDPPKPTRDQLRDLDNRGLRWLDVEYVLHDTLGYTEPYRDLSGRYVARAADDPSLAAPTIVYRTDKDSLLRPGIEIDPDLSGIANVQYVTAKESKLVNPGTVVGVADLDVLFPNHPFAPSQCQLRVEDVLAAPTALSQGAANAYARRELLEKMLAWESITVELASINPQHEGYEIPALQVTGDHELDTAQTTIEQGWEANLTQNRQRLHLARTFAPVDEAA